MIKNNIKAICIHGVISPLSFLIFIIFFSSIPKWVSEEAEKLYYFKMTLVSLIVLIGATYLYYFSGKKILKDQGSILKNLFSVSIVSLFGIFLWQIIFIAFMFEGEASKSGFMYYYYLYNTYSLPLVFILDVDYIFYLFSILFSFIPSISMTAGILMNKRIK